jgi:hypothetical protein
MTFSFKTLFTTDTATAQAAFIMNPFLASSNFQYLPVCFEKDLTVTYHIDIRIYNQEKGSA